MPAASKKQKLFVDVVVDLPVDGEFTYSVPDEQLADVEVGKRVLVPFGKRKVTGYIVKIKKKSDFKRTKPLIEILDLIPLFDEKTARVFQMALFLLFFNSRRGSRPHASKIRKY